MIDPLCKNEKKLALVNSKPTSLFFSLSHQLFEIQRACLYKDINYLV